MVLFGRRSGNPGVAAASLVVLFAASSVLMAFAPAGDAQGAPITVEVQAVQGQAAETMTGRDPRPAVFQFTRTGDASAALLVKFNASGTASNGTDYPAVAGSVVIPAGAHAANITVSPTNDDVIEPAETLILTVLPDAGYVMGAASSTGAVLADNDPEIAIAATVPVSLEPTAGGASIPGVVRVTRNAGLTENLTLDLAAEGTASPSVQYQPLPPNVTIAAGNRSANVTVTALHDGWFHPAAEVAVRVVPREPAYYTGPVDRGVVRILDVDPKPLLSLEVLEDEAVEPDADHAGTPARLQLRLSGNRSAPTPLTYALGGTAANGTNYEVSPWSVTFPAGAQHAIRNVTLTPLHDGAHTGNLTLTFSIASGPWYHVEGPSVATAQLVDRDPLPVVNLTLVPAEPVQENGTAVTIRVARTGPVAVPLSVHYNVTGAAENGTAFEPLPGLLLVPAGNASAEMVLRPIDDETFRGLRTMSFVLVPDAAYVLGSPAQTEVALVDDDPKPAVNVSAFGPAEEAGRPGRLVFARDGSGLDVDLDVNYALNGQARPGVDFERLSGRVRIPAGNGSAEVLVVPVDDGALSPSRALNVTVLPGDLYEVAPEANASLQVVDDDAAIDPTAFFAANVTATRAANGSVHVQWSPPVLPNSRSLGGYLVWRGDDDVAFLARVNGSYASDYWDSDPGFTGSRYTVTAFYVNGQGLVDALADLPGGEGNMHELAVRTTGRPSLAVLLWASAAVVLAALGLTTVVARAWRLRRGQDHAPRPGPAREPVGTDGRADAPSQGGGYP